MNGLAGDRGGSLYSRLNFGGNCLAQEISKAPAARVKFTLERGHEALQALFELIDFLIRLLVFIPLRAQNLQPGAQLAEKTLMRLLPPSELLSEAPLSDPRDRRAQSNDVGCFSMREKRL